MNKWKVLSGISFIFMVGILVGSLGTHIILRHRFPPSPLHQGPKAVFLLKILSKDLSLTDSQKTKVKQILDQTDEKLHQHFQIAEPQVQKIIDDNFNEISKELNDDQKKKLDLMRQRFERRR
jgi:Spy/CpxP family protein refolding chaperone